MEKMTNKKALMYVVDNFAEMPADVAEKINAMIVSLDKKSANRKPTKTQEENNVLKDAIMNVLTTDGKTVSEIIASVPELAGQNTQKVTPLMYQLIADGRAIKVTDKKKSMFAVA